MEQQFPIPNRDYKVLVRCYTYNHSHYIEDALNGFIMQQTNFPFVCLVVDDCSTDGEQEVIKAFLNRECNMENAEYYEDGTTNVIYVKHKNNVNCYLAIYLLKENLYKQKERKMAYVTPWRTVCEYEAMCEGDDYWIDPLKLQKQVKYLENYPDCGLVYTQADILHQATGEVTKNLCRTYNGLKDMFTANPIATLTVMFRIDLYNKYLEEVQPSTKKWLMGDYPMYLWFEINSKIGFIPDTTSIYRAQEESACHSKDINKQIKFVSCHRDISLFFYEKYKLASSYLPIINDYYHRRLLIFYSEHSMWKDALNALKSIENKSIKDYLRLMKRFFMR